MIIYVYDINTLNLIAKPQVKDYETFKKNPVGFYPEWNIQNHLASEIEFQNPIIVDNQIREKAREELIVLDNKVELLVDGEYVEDNIIIKVEAPENMLKKIWNKQTNTWEEGATQEDVLNEIRRLENKFIDLNEQREKRIKYNFDTSEIDKEIKNVEFRINWISKITLI